MKNKYQSRLGMESKWTVLIVNYKNKQTNINKQKPTPYLYLSPFLVVKIKNLKTVNNTVLNL